MKTDTNSTASLERSTYAADFAQRVYVNQAKLSSGTKAILRLHHLWFGLLQFDGSGERAGMQLVLSIGSVLRLGNRSYLILCAMEYPEMRMPGLRDEKNLLPRRVFPNHEMASAARGVAASGGSHPA